MRYPWLVIVLVAACDRTETNSASGWLTAAVVAVAGIVLWLRMLRRERQIREAHPDHENAPIERAGDDNGDDPRDAPPPILYGEEIEDAPKKYILLIAGEMIEDWVRCCAPVCRTWSVAASDRPGRGKGTVRKTENRIGVPTSIVFNVTIFR